MKIIAALYTAVIFEIKDSSMNDESFFIKTTKYYGCICGYTKKHLRCEIEKQILKKAQAMSRCPYASLPAQKAASLFFRTNFYKKYRAKKWSGRKSERSLR